jgi:hypothetical protein
MSDQADVTGRDSYLLVEALTFTVEAPSGLPIELRPDHNIADMKRLVEEFSPGPMVVEISLADSVVRPVRRALERSEDAGVTSEDVVR